MKDPFIKITVLKRQLNEELIKDHLVDEYQAMEKCEKVKEGDVFYVNDMFEPPEGLCQWAWADLRRDIMHVASGGCTPGLSKPNMMIGGCTDWFRPVLFKIELLSEQ